MREDIKEVFDSIKEWKFASDYNRFVHYDNGNSWSPFAERLYFVSTNYSLRICDDNIIEYAVLEGAKWKKTFYECNSLELINNIVEIIESEIPDNGVVFDEDVTDFVYLQNSESITYLSEIQKSMLKLFMMCSEWSQQNEQRDRSICNYVLNSEKMDDFILIKGEKPNLLTI